MSAHCITTTKSICCLPRRISTNGYRVYGQIEVDSLQQILFYRELGLPLDEISRIIHAKDYDGAAALTQHLTSLTAKKRPARSADR